MYQCKKCGLLGGEDEFYPSSRVRCKQCIRQEKAERYHVKYRESILSARRAKHIAAKRKDILLLETERAYAAGLIDGEGSIRLTQRGRNGGTTFLGGQYTLMVELVNTDKKMIDWMVAQFGGSVSYAKPDAAKNKREAWHWRSAANKALYVLDAIYPYLITKKRQAQLGRRFQRYAQYAGRARTERVRRLHERFYNEFRVLNARGLRAQLAKQTLSQ